MSLMISLVDIPPEGLHIDCEVAASEFALSSEDGIVQGSLCCAGQAFAFDDNLASLHGTLTGNVIHECVRCLASFEDRVSLSWDAEFRLAPQSPVVSVPPKKKKKGARSQESDVADDDVNEGDTYPIIDDQIDLLPALREHLILAAPQQPLCHDRCAGLCQLCGANLNEGACSCCSPVTVSLPFVSTALPVLSQIVTKQTSKPS